MEGTQPCSVEEFQVWSRDSTCGKIDQNLASWYENTQNNLFTKVRDTPPFAQLDQILNEAAKRYSSSMNANLFGVGRSADREIDWHRKPYTSFVDKLYRLNIVDNERYPLPPNGKWIRPENSLKLGYVDDIVRTTLVVAYADGPEFLAGIIKEQASLHGLESIVKDHSKPKGYYAYHVYIGLPVHVAQSGPGFVFSEMPVPVEIQITTELQAALREVTHRLYKQERLDGGPGDRWKEDFQSGRFRAAYMAHSLRFIEAMIVDLRGNTLGDKKP